MGTTASQALPGVHIENRDCQRIGINVHSPIPKRNDPKDLNDRQPKQGRTVEDADRRANGACLPVPAGTRFCECGAVVIHNSHELGKLHRHRTQATQPSSRESSQERSGAAVRAMLARAAQEADFAQWLLRVASGHASSESPPAPLSITATVERGAAGPGETLVAAALTPEMRCAVAVTVLWCALLQPSRVSSVQRPCGFNRLCLCSHDVVRDVVCVGVPFSVFPTTIGECENGQVTLVRSGLEVLQNDSLAGTRLSTLRLMHNSLSRILPCAFCGAEDNLVSLDLSNNALAQAPLQAMRGLRHLQWLNLQSNRIDDLRRADWQELSRTVSLRSLFLGENNVKIIRDGLFSNMSELTTLELDRNLVSEVTGSPFPESLTHLSLAHNLLEHLPRQALSKLRSLSALFLGGNLLKTCPYAGRVILHFTGRRLGAGSVYVRDLHMEFNFITELPVGLFRSVSVERLSLANNRMADIAEHVFGGLESVLIVLDLSFNLFRRFPYAARALASLSVLYLRGNALTSLEPADVQSFCATLEVLDLSGNRFDRVPSSALRTTKRLSRLSLQDNRIQMLRDEDFELWARNLTTLSLANNGIRTLSKDTFVHLPRLRELKLSFNAIHFVDHHVFLPLRSTLEVLELSSTLGQRFLPLELIRHMKRVQWLQLDHNQMLNLTDSYLQGLPSLVHFDLEGNRIGHITPGFFKEPIHQRLNRVVLAHNDLNSVDSGTFRNLSRLANVVLLGNKIRVLRSGSFKDLPLLHNVVLSRNRIDTIEAGAFNNLSKLSSLLLQA
ncbi:hypothetical protein MRX96_026478 [Rhipicephalus microplus]